ncbi:hypothetical protein [Caballeronia sp. Lep1P3]|uniref:hypothetical protein n=1 Tax=Caballeronia sp. Lep1P3 TaxID=2878150 RepID=UPI001FD08A24|nr:hypothetical protein [Caballeronia sp. Lep1P3]
MKATIISQGPPPRDSPLELHRFRFRIDGDSVLATVHVVSLRTARVIVQNLRAVDAVIKMLRAIVAARSDDYDALNNSVYSYDRDALWPQNRITGGRRRNEG